MAYITTSLATTSRTTESPARAQSHPPRMVKSARIRMASDMQRGQGGEAASLVGAEQVQLPEQEVDR